MSINSPVVINRIKEMIEVTLDELIIIQGDLKRLDKTSYDKFKAQLIANGFTSPFHIWIDPKGKKDILDGTQRTKVLKMMREEGIIIPDKFKAVVIEAENEKKAREILLGLAAVYGKMTDESLSDFAIESDISLDWISSNIELPFNSSLQVDVTETNKPSEGSDEDIYSKKIKAPVYEITGEKPSLSELFSLDKYNSLLKEIESSNLSRDEKNFLFFSASRHIVFNYKNIAEFYAHANKEMQTLMENSALVIIDFDKAIENGFVKLSKEMNELYLNNGDANGDIDIDED